MQYKVADQEVRTLMAQEEYYQAATCKLKKDDIHSMLSLFTEQ